MLRTLGVLTLTAALACIGCTQSDMNTASDNSVGAGADQSNPAQQERVRERDLTAANTQANQPAQANGQISSTDRQFVRDASAGGAYEVQAGQLATTRSNDNHVKQIGQRMIDDHTKANDQLTSIARRENIPTSSGPNNDQQQMLDKLRGLQGSDFDKEYISQQTQAHRDTIKMFENEAKNGNDADLRSFASQTLPTLREHLQMITGQSTNPGMGSAR